MGRELAVQFAGLGAKVACVDVDPINNEETARIVERHSPGSKVKAYTANVAASAETAALAVRVEQDLGPVDVLINNASVVMAHSFQGATNHAIATIVNINLLGQFWVSPGRTDRNKKNQQCFNVFDTINQRLSTLRFSITLFPGKSLVCRFM